MNRLRAGACALAVGIALTTPAARAQKSPAAQAAYGRAQAHLAGSRFSDAANEMETAVRYEPRFAMGWYVLASAARRAHRCDEAAQAYRRYMELRPAEPDPYFGLGLCLQAVGDLKGATIAFHHYVQADGRPTSREFVEIARSHLLELEHSAAKAAQMPAAAPSASLLQARALRERGRTDEAIARYRATVAAEPGAADAHAELGALLVSARRPREAIAPLQAAVRLAPAAAVAWYNLAFALRESGQAEAAVEAYRRYITFRPEDPDPRYGLGRALASLGRDQQALAAFRTYTALETRPTERQWIRKARQEIARIEAKAPAAPAGQKPQAMISAAAPKPTPTLTPTPTPTPTPTQPPTQASAVRTPGAPPAPAPAAPLRGTSAPAAQAPAARQSR